MVSADPIVAATTNTDLPDTGSTVADIGEFALIDSVTCQPQHSSTILGPGDDAAIVSARNSRAVVSTDILIEGEHFRRDWSDPYSIGRRAIAQNAADIEAMGAHPTGYVVALAAPRDTPATFITEIGRGTVAEAHRSGADIVGGDFSAAQHIVISVTTLGEIVPPVHMPVLQNTAGVEEDIAFAGILGWSAAGLDILSGTFGQRGGFLRHPLVQRACELYRCPHPPYGYGARAAADGATAMTDVSDGLLVDLQRVIQRSNDTTGAGSTMFTADLSYEKITEIAGESLRELATVCAAYSSHAMEEEQLLRTWVLSGGEDHGLLAFFPHNSALPGGFHKIGTTSTAMAADSAHLISMDGNGISTIEGWESFA